MASGDFWWECKQHRLPDGRWTPEVFLYEARDDGIERARLLPRTDVSFESEDEARSYGETLASKRIANIKGA